MNNLKQYLKLDPKRLGSINSVKFIESIHSRLGKRRMEITAQMAGQYWHCQIQYTSALEKNNDLYLTYAN